MKIKILETVLTDMSKVYDVVIRTEAGEIMQLACVTEADADALMVGLAGLIEAHTNDVVEV